LTDATGEFTYSARYTPCPKGCFARATHSNPLAREISPSVISAVSPWHHDGDRPTGLALFGDLGDVSQHGLKEDVLYISILTAPIEYMFLQPDDI